MPPIRPRCARYSRSRDVRADHPVIVHLDNPRYLHRWVSRRAAGGRTIGGHVLARPAHLDPAEGGERQRHRHRRTGQHRHPHTLASHGAAALDRLRRRHRRAIRQSLWPLEPDQARARARRAGRCGAGRAGRRRLAHRSRVHHRVVSGQRGASAAARTSSPARSSKQVVGELWRSAARRRARRAIERCTTPRRRRSRSWPRTIWRRAPARSWRARKRWRYSRCGRRCTPALHDVDQCGQEARCLCA